MVERLTFRIWIREEEGFSLTELIVVLVLLGVILAISYGGLQAVYVSNEVSDRQAAFAREVGTPLAAIEEVLTQALAVENPGPYSITVLTDRDNDNVVERHQIQATTAGLVTHRTWLTNSSRVNTTLVFDSQWSENNVNLTDGVSVFKYYARDGAEITNMATAATDARTIQVTLRVDYNGHPASDSRTVLLRNR